MKKRIFSAAAAVTAAIAAITTMTGCSLFSMGQTTNAMGSYDFKEMKLIQLDPPAEGQDVAIIETDRGTMTAVLYSEYAPNTVDNFKKRVNEGFYNGKSVFALQTGVYAITGASNEEGTEGITDNGKYIQNECSVNLWPFKGAIMGYSGEMGFSDSRFFFCGAIEVTEENLKELRGYTNKETGEQIIPEELLEAFLSQGSVPGFGAAYTVFAQVINGFDTLDAILWTESDSKTKKPKEDIIIKKITLDKYSADKFELEKPTADKYVTAEELEKIEAEMNASSSQ